MKTKLITLLAAFLFSWNAFAQENNCEQGYESILINITTDTYSAYENSYNLSSNLGLDSLITIEEGSILNHNYCIEIGSIITLEFYDIYGDGIINGGYEIIACGDTIASNFDFTDDYELEEFQLGCGFILGCSDSIALNYNPAAIGNDGSCEYQCEPNWVVVETSNTMFVNFSDDLEVQIDSNLAHTASAIGAFYFNENGELSCAGYSFINNLGTTLTLYGDDDATESIDGLTEGDEYLWYIFDGANCEDITIFVEYLNEANTYTNNDTCIIESIQSITPINTCQTIAFPAGWSLISTYIEITQPYNEAHSFFSDLVNNDSFIISKNDHGSAFVPPWGFTHSIDNNEGYQVKLSTSDTLIQCGLQISPESYPITLEQGWNIMPYLKDTPQDAVEALSTISSEIHLVKNILGQVYMPSWDYNGIGNLEPGKGYQIKMNSEQILIYDAND